ncbi:MAG TPA: hypothetical protein VKE70_13220, partial [Candidatus Solibacter sp.]|nr:hypothetical protein [Candidatus Solibacter sp.]
YRQIFLDGRTLPEVVNPSFMGYSVGHWEGDTLVVETIGYNEKTKLDISVDEDCSRRTMSRAND